MGKVLPIKGKFSRWTQSKSDDQEKTLPIGWFAIRSDWVPKDNRPKLRGKWHKISCGRHSCYRALSMDPTLKGSMKMREGQIRIDWDGWLALHGNESPDRAPAELTIHPAVQVGLLPDTGALW